MKTIRARIMGGEPVRVPKEKTLQQISEDYKHLFTNEILLAKVDYEVTELHRHLSEDCSVEFLDICNPHGYRTFRPS